MSDPAWHASRSKRLQIAAIVHAAAPLLMLLRWTLRWQVAGREHLDAVAAAGPPPIMGFWHGRILPGMFFFRKRGIVVLTSQNFDGEWIARIIARFGFGAVRGSSSRNASGALRELVRVIRGGRSVAFTLDGPRGPAFAAKGGAVWLAGMTGSPILPFHCEATRAWQTRSWDQGAIPKPFATVAMAFAEPLQVPRGLDEAGVDAYCRELESRLASARAVALTMTGKGGAA